MNKKRVLAGVMLLASLSTNMVAMAADVPQTNPVVEEVNIQQEISSKALDFYPTQALLLGCGYSKGSYVNIRSGPGTSYRSLGKLNKGDEIKVYQTPYDKVGNWAFVMVEVSNSVPEGTYGWMYWDYIEPGEPAR